MAGPLSVSVPGCVDGWFELNKKFGKLPMSQILSSAINYARNGFPLADEAAYYWTDLKEHYGNNPNFNTVYLPGGKAPQRGDIFKNPLLANTLEKIAVGGRDVFYKGEIAKSIDAFMKKMAAFFLIKI